MKKYGISIIIIILFLIVAVPFTAYAVDEQDAKSEFTQQLDDILADFEFETSSDEIESLSFGGFVKAVAEKVSVSEASPFKLLGGILLVTVLSAMLKSVGSVNFKGSADIYGLVSVLSAVTVISPQLFAAFSK